MSRRARHATGYDDAGAFCEAIRAGDRRAVAKAITLLESTRRDRAELGQAVLEELVPYTGQAVHLARELL